MTNSYTLIASVLISSRQEKKVYFKQKPRLIVRKVYHLDSFSYNFIKYRMETSLAWGQPQTFPSVTRASVELASMTPLVAENRHY